jgi:hypothetical protein
MMRTIGGRDEGKATDLLKVCGVPQWRELVSHAAYSLLFPA